MPVLLMSKKAFHESVLVDETHFCIKIEFNMVARLVELNSYAPPVATNVVPL